MVGEIRRRPRECFGSKEYFELHFICKQCEDFKKCGEEAKKNGYPKYLDRKRQKMIKRSKTKKK